MIESTPNFELSIIIPIYNEAGVIKELVERVCQSAVKCTDNYQVILVNDGSSDDSLSVIKNVCKDNSHLFYINLSRNFGHQVAVTAGLDRCEGKAVVIMDGDLQDPPELIPDLFNKYKEGFEVVVAKRISREGESVFKKMTAKWFYRLLKRLTNISIPLDAGDFRLVDKKVVDLLKQMPEKNKFLRGQIAWMGFKTAEVEFDRAERKHGKTGYSLNKMIRFALDGITGFSDKPLQLVTKLGLFFSLFSFCVIIYALYSYFVLNRVITGWTSMIISTMFIGGVQLLSIGIIGMYISRMNTNIQNRPLYIVSETDLD